MGSAPADTEDGLMAPAPGFSPEGSSTDCSVVLVEDHPVLRRRFTDQLADAGLRVVASVGSVEAGRDAVLMHRPDVAVVGSNLPDGRGVDLCRSVLAAFPETILLLHAGVVSAVEEREALDLGVAAVIPKAIRGGYLMTAVLTHSGCSRPDPS
jgi:two-component system response regulator DevR